MISSVELVFRNTREAILDGVYQPGLPLRLADIAAQNNVSLIPVREALRMLEAGGFVESARNKGARVTSLSKADLLDVYGTRIVLELEALRQAFDNLTPDNVRQVGRLHDQMMRQMRAGVGGFRETHQALHFAIYDQARSPWLDRLIRVVWDHTERYRRISAAKSTLNEISGPHLRIIEALERRDLEASLTALREHLEQTAATVARVYDRALAKEGSPRTAQASPKAS